MIVYITTQGLCHGPNGEICANAEFGRKIGKKAWDEANQEEREATMEAEGVAEALANYDEEDWELLRQAGREGGQAGWDGLDEEDS